jgi:1-acyl-sn-glycerol-3-phosphate acyltransferase
MDEWRYQPALDLDEPLLQRLRRFPREPDMLSYGVRGAAALVLRCWLRAYHGFHVVGSENVPPDRSAVLVANHGSHLDALCLLSAVPLWRLHRAFPAAAADYFFVSLPRIAVSVLVVNALPFHRETHVRQSLAVCRQLLAEPGNLLIIFPEGTRSLDGRLGEFRPGIGMLVAGSHVPVVPCYLSGTHDALPKGCRLPRPRRIRLTIGAPRTYPAHTQDKESLREVCRDIRDAVLELAGARSAASSESEDPAQSEESGEVAGGGAGQGMYKSPARNVRPVLHS